MELTETDRQTTHGINREDRWSDKSLNEKREGWTDDQTASGTDRNTPMVRQPMKWTQRYTDGQTANEMDTEIYRWSDSQCNGHRDIQMVRQPMKWTQRYTDGQIANEMDTEIYRWSDSQ